MTNNGGLYMYGLPEDIDLSFFVKKKLELVCFASYSLYLHFDGGVLLTVEGKFDYGPNGENGDGQWRCFPLPESDLMRFLESEVISAKGERNGTLTLTFSNNKMLRISGDNDSFESYSIKHGGVTIVV
jgi:hypothetical protein